MSTRKQKSDVGGDDEFVSIDKARSLIAGRGNKPVPRERVFQMAVEGHLELKRFANRWFVRWPDHDLEPVA